jgi:hypothetical protein
VKRIDSRRRWGACLVWSGIMLLLAGCGTDSAIPGTTIIGPADSTITYQPPGGILDQTSTPLEFQVFAPATVPVSGAPTDGLTPLSGATIRFFGGVQVVALTDRNGLGQLGAGTPCLGFLLLPQNCLNPSDNLFFQTLTDERGLSPTDVYAVWFVPQCKHDLTDATKAGPDVVVTGTVEATVGVASKTWTITITVKGGPAAAPSNCV